MGNSCLDTRPSTAVLEDELRGVLVLGRRCVLVLGYLSTFSVLCTDAPPAALMESSTSPDGELYKGLQAGGGSD